MYRRMARTIPLKFLGIIILAAFAFVPGTGQPADAGSAPVEQPVVQSSVEALEQDLGLMARGQGLTMEQARALYRERAVLGETLGKVSEAKPDVFVGGAGAGATTSGLAEIYIKGPADQAIRDIVASAEIQIRLVDEQPFSRDELEQHHQRIIQNLRAMGFQSVSSGLKFDGAAKILVFVSPQPGLPTDAREVLSNLPDDLSSNVTLKVVVPPDFSGVDFGPLAVRKPAVGEGYPLVGDVAGPVRIGKRCVTLTSARNGKTLLLVWWADQVQWFPDRGEIRYSPAPNEKPLIIRDGTRIALPPDNLSLDRPPQWVSPPHDDCKWELHDTLGLELVKGD